MINFRRTFAWLSRSIRARHGHPPPLARDDRNTSGLDRVPVAIVDVSAVETFDHFGGAGASFDGLEDAEGDQGAAANLYLRASPAPYWITFAPPASRRHAIAPPAPDYIAIVALMPPPSLSSSFWVAEQDTAGTAASARACSHRPRVTPR